MSERWLMSERFGEKFKVAKNFDLLTPEQFRRDFCNEIALAVEASSHQNNALDLPDSVRPSMGLESMWIEFFGENMKVIHTSVLNAAKAGFNVEIHRDWFSDTLLDGDYLFLPPTRFAGKERSRHRKWVYGFTQKRLALLEDAGAKIVPINVPKSLTEKATFLLRGRDHKKITFVKGPKKIVTWVGGMGLAEEHFRQLDFMVKIDDPAIVQLLIDEFKRVGNNKRITNAKICATKDTTILVDTGKEESVIMAQTIRDWDAAEKSIYVSGAFLPFGKSLDSLVRAKKRGVHVAYITSNPNVVMSLLGIQGKLSDIRSRRKGKLPVMFPEKRPVHAKASVVDEKIAMIGSHNFVEGWHEELSLRSENTTLVKNVTDFLQKISGGNLRRELKEDFIIPDHY